jgi:hypothetical protein
MKQKTSYGGYGLEGPLQEEKRESKRAGTRVLTAIGVGAAAIAILSIVAATLPAVGHVESGNVSTKASAASEAVPSHLSAKVIGSSVITISDYYKSGGYNTSLQCLADSIPIYCDGGPVIIQGFPSGIHTFSVMEDGEPSSLEFHVS